MKKNLVKKSEFQETSGSKVKFILKINLEWPLRRTIHETEQAMKQETKHKEVLLPL